MQEFAFYIEIFKVKICVYRNNALILHPQCRNAAQIKVCGSSSVDRALAFQAGGRGFEPRLPLTRKKEAAFWLLLFFFYITAQSRRSS